MNWQRMKKKLLKAPYKCHHCDEDFTYGGEEIYNICNLVLEESNIDNQLHWRWVDTEKDKIRNVSYYFHRECFESAAGKYFLGQKL